MPINKSNHRHFEAKISTMIPILSHRGGQTDYDKALRDVSTKDKPAENTIAAFDAALTEGADGVECDVVRTKDDRLAIIHSAKLSEHVFQSEHKNIGFVGDYTMAQLKETYRVGPRADGVIPELSELLALAEAFKRKGRDVTLNIEMKDVKGTTLSKTEKTSVVPLLKKYLSHSKLEATQIILSSFALKDVEHAAALGLGTKLAFLFDAKAKTESAIYANDTGDHYLQFTPANIDDVCAKVPSLSAVHAEINTVSEKELEHVQQHKLALGTWSAAEPHPNKVRKQLAVLFSGIVRHHVDAYVITNFVKEMRQELAAIVI